MKKAITLFTILFLFVLAFRLNVGAENPTDNVEVTSLSIESYPTKTVYYAFEEFSPSGMLLRANYSDGSGKIVPHSDIIVTYQNDSCFRAEDNGVTLSYGGKSILLPVTVNRVSYDLSSLELREISKVYNGKYQTYTDGFAEILGLDGLPLRVSAVGGGINVGSYEVIIDFYSDSTDYLIPDSRVATMLIEPQSVNLVWTGLSFTYDGKSKLPSACYIDVNGNTVYPSVIGSATNAGVGYIAKSYSSDPNYTFENPSECFEIKKANYDFSSAKWSADSFIYDGGQKSITVSGLPAGVSIIGYVNQSYSKAGSYTTTAELEWDTNNYNPPPALTHSWEIKKADYDMSRVIWQNEVVTYSGKPLFPTLTGLPEGVKVVGYSGDEAINAGNYTIAAIFEYDSENYNKPNIPVCNFTIQKRPINIPHLKGVYNGRPQQPNLQSSLYVVISSQEQTEVGIYAVSIMLTDPDNYVFAETGSQMANAIFEILPASLSIRLLDQKLHLFEVVSGGEYEITYGVLFGDDRLNLEYYSEGNRILAISNNPNYTVKIESGSLVRLPYPTLKDGIKLLCLALALAVVVFAIVLAVRKRADIARSFAIAKCRWHNRNYVAPHPVSHTPSDLKIPEFDVEEETDQGAGVIDIEEGIRFMDSEVDGERADLLITDQLAKSLIKKEGDVVYTSGSEKECIDVGVISENFSAGETVDVNILKKKGLIDKSTAYLRIMPGGSVDKSLIVYSNEFDLTAVKMIALSGGQAIKCITLKGKNGKTT